MKNLKIVLLGIFSVLLLNSCLKEVPEKSEIKNADFGIVVHGGAGYMKPEWYNDEQIKAYEEKLQEAIDTGYSIIENGGKAVDAVSATLQILEDSPLFNAGKGAVFTSNGKNELDASIMDGSNLNSGAVAGVSHIKNPIALAKLVMDSSKHVMFARDGAEKFAKEMGVEFVDEDYFYTEGSWKELQRAKEADEGKEKGGATHASLHQKILHSKMGTTGCTVLDKHGNLAAGTTTGGLTNKKYGRVGDSPIIGAGTYANNNTCAVSATGHGEFFIRYTVTHDISALMEYKGLSLKEATDKVIMDKLVKAKADGGVIAIDKRGFVSMEFNTPGMFRGYKLNNGDSTLKIFK